MLEILATGAVLAGVIGAGTQRDGDLAELWCFESTLRGGSKLVHVAAEDGAGHVLLRLDRGLAHAALVGDAELAGAAARWCAGAEGWSVELCADTVSFTRSTNEGVGEALAVLVERLGGDDETDDDETDGEEDAGEDDAEVVEGDSPEGAEPEETVVEPTAAWRRFRETGFPGHPIGRTIAGDADPAPEDLRGFLRDQWGPEGAALVVIGGESGEVHRAVSTAMEAWSRARSPRRELARAPDPRGPRVVASPATDPAAWVGFRLAWSQEGMLAAEAALAVAAGSWPRRLHGSFGTLLGARLQSGDGPERLAALSRGELDHAATRRAIAERIAELESDPAALAAELARALSMDGDPRAGLRALTGLARASEEEWSSKLEAATALLRRSHPVTVHPGAR